VKIVRREKDSHWSVRPARHRVSTALRWWRGLTGRSDPNGDILHLCGMSAKCGRWPTLDGEHLSKPKTPTLSADDVETLKEVYDDFVVAFGSAPRTSPTMTTSRRSLHGICRPRRPRRSGGQLIARLTELRKRGLLTKVADVPKPVARDADTGFRRHRGGLIVVTIKPRRGNLARLFLRIGSCTCEKTALSGGKFHFVPSAELRARRQLVAKARFGGLWSYYSATNSFLTQ